MTPEDPPPSEFVLALYDDIHRPCGGIEEYIGGWVCQTRNAEGGTRNPVPTPRRPRRQLPPSAIRVRQGWVLWSWADYQEWLAWVHTLTYPVQLKVGQF